MKLTLLALALIIGQSSVWACLGGFGGSSGCCSGPIGGCGAQPQCAPSGGYGYNAPLAGPALPPPPPPFAVHSTMGFLSTIIDASVQSAQDDLTSLRRVWLRCPAKSAYVYLVEAVEDAEINKHHEENCISKCNVFSRYFRIYDGMNFGVYWLLVVLVILTMAMVWKNDKPVSASSSKHDEN
ncbi:hypothetical protein M3Y97_00420100 [Aphelenchoides bicaudatus]|nr:hypothetical protein M3Y97_00420100 [Aphelenchoides bicaudatus]